MPIKENLQRAISHELGVAEEVQRELLPRIELLGGLTNLNMTKKANMDHHQYTLRG